MNTYRGSCHCGAIRFTFKGPDMLRVVRCLPYREEGQAVTTACGQASHKPRGRKPRDAARWFGLGVAYGDLTSAVAPGMPAGCSVKR